MPKSKKRRPKTRVLAELPILQATDDAEARGDARGALDLIGEDLERRADKHFWRPERLLRLTQLYAFGPSLPGFVTSRWILAQAAQQLDNRLRGRGRQAIEIAVETRGGPDTLVGVDDVDARSKVIDHDWIHRQVFLYELGALRHFVARTASPDLLRGADRIRDWMRAPMGAFRFVEETPLALTLLDLASGDEVTALNVGSASLLEEGDCAIGRLVPIEGGVMFESAPLFVPERVARQVAGDPSDWVGALAAGCRAARDAGSRLNTTLPEFGMVTDVPRFVQHRLAIEVAWARGEQFTVKELTDDVLKSAQVGLVRAALDDRIPATDWEGQQWPMVAATLLDPGVFAEVARGLGPGDAARMLVLADRLAGPAGVVCRELAGEVETAA